MSDFTYRDVKGVVPPVITPLDWEGDLDEKSLKRLVDYLIDGGVNGLFFLGSSGGVAFANDSHREQVVSAAVDVVNGRVPVLVGVIDIETRRVIDQIKRVESIAGDKVDGVVATAPFYALQTEKEIERHFRMLREATDIPVFAYDIPPCVHVKLGNDLLMRLARDGIIAGVKDSSGDDIAFRRLCLANVEAGHPMQVLTGHEFLVDAMYMYGADGSVPGVANVDPFRYAEQWKAFQEGDIEQVFKLNEDINRLKLITKNVKATKGFGSGPGAYKTALWLLGIIDTNQMEDPVEPLEGEDVETIRSIMEKEGFLSER